MIYVYELNYTIWPILRKGGEGEGAPELTSCSGWRKYHEM